MPKETAPHHNLVLRAALPEILDAEALGIALNLSQARVRDLFRDGTLPARKLGRRWIARREDVLAALAPGVTRREPASPGVAWCPACGDRPVGPDGGPCAPCRRDGGRQ